MANLEAIKQTVARIQQALTAEIPAAGWALECPDVCSVCGINLKDEGYPTQHQNDEGGLCSFNFDADGWH